MKKVLSTFLVLALLFTLTNVSTSFAAEEKDKSLERIEKFEKESEKLTEWYHNKARTEAFEEMDQKNIDKDSSQGRKIMKEHMNKLEDVYNKKYENLNKKHGWNKVKTSEPGFGTSSYSSHMGITNTLYVSSYDGTYRAEGFATWQDTSLVDALNDAEDPISIGADKDITHVSNYGYTYSSTGYRTGYASNGSWDANSCISDSHTESDGFIWNVIDDCDRVGDASTYKTKVKLYFKNPNSGSVSLYTNYAHNYQEVESSTTASFSVSIKDFNGGMAISYSNVNKAWGPIQGNKMDTSNPIVQ
jgi:TolA-binding protein